jgi:tetratricopeptide (TPR) repeat protein
MRMGRALGLAVVVLAVCVGARAWAETAKEHYERGTTLFDLQKYAEAAVEYEKAYQIRQEPALLYNLGQAYRFAGNPTKAMGAYRSFLRRMPSTPRRAEVERLIREMQELEEQQKHPPPAPEPAPAPAPAPAGVAPPPAAPVAVQKPFDLTLWRRVRTAGIATSVVGLGVLGAGIGLDIVGNQKFNQINNPVVGTTFDSGTQSDMNLFRGLGISFIAVGATAIVTGVTLLAVAHRKITVAARGKQ